MGTQIGQSQEFGQAHSTVAIEVENSEVSLQNRRLPSGANDKLILTEQTIRVGVARPERRSEWILLQIALRLGRGRRLLGLRY